MWGKVVAAYLSVPDRVRPFLNWGVRAIVAGAFLSFWMNVATFAFAIRYGARPPVEGVPFLSLIAGVAGVGVVLVTFFSISALPALLRWTRSSSHQISELSTRFVGKFTPKKIARTLTTVAVRIFGIALVFVANFVLSGLSPTETIKQFLQVFISLIDSLLSVFGLSLGGTNLFVQWVFYAWIGISAFLILFFAVRFAARLSDKVIQYSANALFFLGLVSLAAATLMAPFDHLLRATQFGGGVKVDVLTRDGNSIENAFLFLMSENSVTLWDEKSGRFFELNRDYVIEVNYLPNDYWRLPKSRSIRQILRANDLRSEAAFDSQEVSPTQPDTQ